jgi:branched-chain amino acid transport system ATP-binding protein
LLKVEGIDVYYGDLQALWNVSFTVEAGEVVTVLGPNGAGKTTLLKTISGLLRPRSGAILFENKRIDGAKPHQIINYGLAHVPEGRQIFPYMTVEENLELGASTKKVREKLKDSLEFVYQLFPILKQRRKQLAGTLSGGEQQMLAIGRGLMSRPRLLMLDEPSLGLAPKVILSLFKLLKEMNRQGLSILLVEQNVRQALEIAHRGYILETGRIVVSKSSKELISDPYVKKSYLGI